MARGGEKTEEGTEEVGSAEKYIGTGSINHTGAGNLIQGGDTGLSSLWVGDVGDNTPHDPGPGVLLE